MTGPTLPDLPPKHAAVLAETVDMTFTHPDSHKKQRENIGPAPKLLSTPDKRWDHSNISYPIYPIDTTVNSLSSTSCTQSSPSNQHSNGSFPEDLYKSPTSEDDPYSSPTMNDIRPLTLTNRRNNPGTDGAPSIYQACLNALARLGDHSLARHEINRTFTRSIQVDEKQNKTFIDYLKIDNQKILTAHIVGEVGSELEGMWLGAYPKNLPAHNGRRRFAPALTCLRRPC
ncbi:hypothetical protein B0H14DRAFT_3466059 [Mycena olivaceomarginata]|nr:hypothetical protein B0H14DRAFT_3466059 [Mycena olivaceomarginata]